MARAVLITPWFGEPPEWMPQFRERIAASPGFEHKLILTDPPDAARRIAASGAAAAPKYALTPRKYCDWRPLWGSIYHEEIGNADYWGWCDLDCVFGDLTEFVRAPTGRRVDFVTDHPHLLNGPLTLVRNNLALRDVLESRPGRDKALDSPEYQGWDEQPPPAGTSVFYGAGGRWHAHDGQEPPPALSQDSGKLYSAADGRELVTYHFSTKIPKAWPL